MLVQGDGTFAISDSPVTLTGAPSNVLGTAAITFTADSVPTDFTFTDNGDGTATVASTVAGTITGTAEAVDSGRTAPDDNATDTWSVTFQAVAPTTFTWGFETVYEGGPLPAGLELFGEDSNVRTEQGETFEVPRQDSGIRITAADMVWDEVPTRRTENFPTGVNALAVRPTQAEADAGNISAAAASEVFGSYTVTGPAFGRVIWSGGSLRATAIQFGPMNFRAALNSGLPVWSDTPITSATASNFTRRTFIGDNNVTRTGANLSAAFTGHQVGGLRPTSSTTGTKYILGTIGTTNYNVAGTVASGGAFGDFILTITSVTEI